MTRTIRLFTLASIAFALLASAAQASPQQTSIMMDDDLLVYRDDGVAARALTQMKALGVDTVRVTVLWKIVAENARLSKAQIKPLKGRFKTAAQKQARRFKATNPATYPTRNWDRFDNLVRAAGERGIRIYFNVTGPGPEWAHTKPPKSMRALRNTWKPRPAAFKQFVTAVGKRFSGSYRDDNGCRCALPRVSFWSLWNEPNQAGWLSPQWEKVGSARIPVAAQLFRRLHQFGYKGLVASGHGIDSDTILLAETAPLGTRKQTSKAPLLPAAFLREVACVKPNGTKYSGRAARLRACGDFAKFGRLNANGYAHHPYTKNVPTTQRHPDADAITMANISELGTLLDSLSSKTAGKIPNALALYMTEFGFETNPPDPFSGVSWADQAKHNTTGEFLAFANPRIAAQSQFLLRDVPPVANRDPSSKAYWFTYQSGLFTSNGSPKLSAYSYQLPFLAFRGGLDAATGLSNFTFWGQLRFLKDGAPENAVIQAKPAGGVWADVGPPISVSNRGYFTAQRTAPAPGAVEWRGAWKKADGTIGVVSLPTSGQ